MNYAQRKILLSLYASIVLTLSFSSSADSLLSFSDPTLVDPSKHKIFVSSQNSNNDGYDVWKLDSGYSYSVLDSVDLYIGTRVQNSSVNSSSSFLSGINYKFSEHVSLKSSLYKSESHIVKTPEALAAELSGQIQLTDKLNFHATYDYEDWQQGIEVGLGFSF